VGSWVDLPIRCRRRQISRCQRPRGRPGPGAARRQRTANGDVAGPSSRQPARPCGRRVGDDPSAASFCGPQRLWPFCRAVGRCPHRRPAPRHETRQVDRSRREYVHSTGARRPKPSLIVPIPEVLSWHVGQVPGARLEYRGREWSERDPDEGLRGGAGEPDRETDQDHAAQGSVLMHNESRSGGCRRGRRAIARPLAEVGAAAVLDKQRVRRRVGVAGGMLAPVTEAWPGGEEAPAGAGPGTSKEMCRAFVRGSGIAFFFLPTAGARSRHAHHARCVHGRRQCRQDRIGHHGPTIWPHWSARSADHRP